MIVVPTYNMILSPEATLYLPQDMLRRSAGHRGIAAGEKLILIVAKENVALADMTEDSFRVLMEHIPFFTAEDTWISADVVPGREDERWWNMILRKKASK